MAKQKRARQKYKIACVKAREKEAAQKNKEKMNTGSEEKLPKDVENVDINLSDDNMAIDETQVDKNLDQDDAKSVRTMNSVSKSYKSIKRSIGSTMSKVDKRKLKHELFLKKIEFNHELLKHAKKGGKKGKEMPSTIEELDSLFPSANMLHHTSSFPSKSKIKQPKPVSTKIKGVKKTKQRQMDLSLNLQAFKSVISDSNYKTCPLDIVTESIQDRVLNQDL